LRTITSINGLQNLNVANNINAGTISASITTANQPNITNIGTLTNLNVSNNINTANLTASGIVNAATFSALSGTINNLTVPGMIEGGTFSGIYYHRLHKQHYQFRWAYCINSEWQHLC
jgi:hypothetical protein